MPQNPNRLDLLLMHADEPAPVLGRGLRRPDTETAPAPRARPAPDLLWNESADANDLAAQRWGVIAPRGPEGDRLLELIAPLIAHRQRAQHGRSVRIYRVASQMDLAQAMRWKKRVFRKNDDLDTDLPRYQLILGDLDLVPLAVQQVQATDGFVGRLAFDKSDEYRAYCDKLIGFETRPHQAALADAILHTVHDRTPATERGYAALMEPGHQILQKRHDFGDVRARAIRATGTQKPALEELWQVTGDRHPSVLFSLSHGAGPPRTGWVDAGHQRRLQGALSFGADGLLVDSMLAERQFLPGGMWMALACFGAGSAETSDYHHWLDTLRRIGHVGTEIEHVLNTLAHERPFIAAVPKAALRNPNGPLAFIGHVDLAWAYSFFDLDERPMRRPGRLMGVIQSLLSGDRVGVAMRTLHRFFEETNTELTALYDAHARTGRGPLDARARAQRGHLWMLRQDLAGYILLGDPAARLPLGAPTAQSSFAAGSPQLASSGVDAEVIEQAIHNVLGGASAALAAATHGLDERTLANLVEVYRAAGLHAIQAQLASQ